MATSHWSASAFIGAVASVCLLVSPHGQLAVYSLLPATLSVNPNWAIDYRRRGLASSLVHVHVL
ncbi:hypothetical protein EDB82DRAFT_521101 [Fusarium venenatum]|uniref:uncharacterized protein n=1 Tax=Fusarium venenatum TaxID=56646 RepID=UPI001DC415B8|nr:hypothetical protein EDB82DRAFT_521101 [Fusarium venenatum]